MALQWGGQWAFLNTISAICSQPNPPLLDCAATCAKCICMQGANIISYFVITNYEILVPLILKLFKVHVCSSFRRSSRSLARSFASLIFSQFLQHNPWWLSFGSLFFWQFIQHIVEATFLLTTNVPFVFLSTCVHCAYLNTITPWIMCVFLITLCISCFLCLCVLSYLQWPNMFLHTAHCIFIACIHLVTLCIICSQPC